MANLNAVVKIEKDVEAWDGKVGINSVFYTIQGEGPLTGTPAVFIRLQGCCLNCSWCFVGTTRIAVPEGKDKPIVEIGEGDRVYSLNTETQQVEVKPVKRVMVRTADEVLKVKYGSNQSSQMYVTPEHPLWVIGKGWVKALDVQVGDVLFNITHNGREVVSIERINAETNPKAYTRLAGALDAEIPVYNLEVEDTHTYFANQCLVHNCDTLYTEGERIPIFQVVEKVKNAFIDGSHIGSLPLGNELLPHPLVVITGGEPFVQIGMPRLVKYLVNAGYRVQIETSGSAWQPEFETVAHIADVHNLRVQVVCSPKTGKVNKHLSHYVTAWKYVVKAGEVDADDGLPNTSPETGRPLMLARPPIRKPNVYISPCDEYDEVKNAANVKEAVRVVMQYGYKLSLQVHKLVGVD